ncbi:hypothetical protein [Streptomyces sp. NRRL B-24720]|uniref:hypothetical protein n=1 Tax=Streptomyces sp. NRRL B-24720 TaxID=1476876 RepID=UPI000A8DAF0D|nr:hypothetical protein [Streptomyces sp. NRRL B-24720]
MAWDEWQQAKAEVAANGSAVQMQLNQAAASGGGGAQQDLVVHNDQTVAVVAVPLAIETIGGAANTQFGNETMQWLKDHEFENHDEAAQGIDKAKAEGRQNAMGPLLNYVEAHNMESGEVRTLMGTAEDTYNRGGRLSDTDDARGW